MNAATTITDLASILAATHLVTNDEVIQHAVWDVVLLDKPIEYVAHDRGLSILTVRNYVAKTRAAVFQAAAR